MTDSAQDRLWPTAPLEVYRRSADSMRSTAQAITALVPGAGIIVGLTTVVPGTVGLRSSDRAPALLLMAGAAVATAIVVLLASQVQSAATEGWGTLLRDHARSLDSDGNPHRGGLADAIQSERVLQLYGYPEAARFFAALLGRDQDLAPSAVAAATTLLDFVTYRQVRQRFTHLVLGGLLAGLAAIVFLGAAQVVVVARTADAPAVIASGARISVVAQGVGLGRLAVESHCVGLVGGEIVTGRVIGGTWSQATLIIDDTRCSPGRLTWSADRDGLIIPR